MVVRFLTFLRTSAWMRFSGMPHSPKPPTMMLAPSSMSKMAASALATTLFTVKRILNQARDEFSNRLRRLVPRAALDELDQRAAHHHRVGELAGFDELLRRGDAEAHGDGQLGESAQAADQLLCVGGEL